ncbi:unnamed protein product [Didymodactylos carnosus]|uniref:Uncharacterized protein n=1 Tax=Didymodactylos carnosus TaxID=1234261 RepID=A0A815HU51_9BILA|nr:unnamed protein product [Didymodactylos carnosus]CAF1357139.1 unnamed protein product [Didymodactylos carnosus]CAF3623564.1 unnamed protein product [Didymodactylos carnosus]CAF4231829.1 unnamed protein product [Didymodactylos carnosus]
MLKLDCPLFLLILFCLGILLPSNLAYHDFNLYEITSGTEEYFDCLYLSAFDHIVSYCVRRSSGDHESPSYDQVNGQPYTSQQLRDLGVTESDLYDWSVSIGMIEAYQLSQSDDELLYYHCTPRCFGSVCQYTFSSTTQFFDNIIYFRQSMKTSSNPADVIRITNGTYYIYLKNCSETCIDWREICDGKSDCIFGEDQHEGHFLESNDCGDQDKFRCQNGQQCIPMTLFRNDGSAPDCLGGSDETVTPVFDPPCAYNANTYCDIQYCFSCKVLFPCGGGQCSQHQAPTTIPV